jgi:hypothetical protein
MEDVLDLYAEADDEERPKVNFDETSKPLIKETRPPLQRRSVGHHAMTTSMSATAYGTCLWVANRKRVGGMGRLLSGERKRTLRNK